MRTNKETAADWRPRRASDGKNSIAFFFAHQCEFNSVENAWGHGENPPAIPDAPLDRTAFAKGRPANPQPVDPRFFKRRFEEVRATSSTGPGRIGARRVKA